MPRREMSRGRRGPQLPFKLSKEIFGAQYSERRAGDKSSRRRNETPKEIFTSGPRQLKAQVFFNKRKMNGADALPGSTSKRNRVDPTAGNSTIKRRTDAGQTQKKGANRFSELLPQGAHMDREKLLQRDLARKLGMKKKSTTHLPGDEDGLDELMQEFDDGIGNDYSDHSGSQDKHVEGRDGARSSRDASSQKESDEQPGSVDLDESSLSGQESDDWDDGQTIESSSELEPESESEHESEHEDELVSRKVGQKYVPPALRRLAESGDGESSQRVVRQIRGLLNRMAESNMTSIVEQISSLYQNEGRSLVSATVASELVSASAEGPRATQRFAAVAAALISGLAGLNKSQEIVASFLAKVAEALQASLKAQEADSLAIDHLCENFLEANIAAIAQLLQAAGLVLRSSDPERMKGFIISVHARAAEVGVKNLSARARVMMDIVVDVKNNRKRELTKQMTQTLDAHMLRWLKNTGISSVALGGISWNKVLEKDKRGFWWLPSAKGAVSYRDGGNLPVGATGSIALLADQGSTPPETLLKLASQMNMNTDTRRAVFCAIMGSEDAIDATEKLLSLGLKGDQERQMVRVNIECCLAEKSYNPYYLQVLKRLCTLDKNHRVTLQYCMWDNWKTLERLEVGPLHNLARLGGAALCSSCLSPTALRVVEFLSSVVTPKQLLFWRILFESMLKEVGSQEEMVTLFSKVMTADNLADLRRGLLTFIKQSLGPWIARKELDSNPGSSSVKVETLLKRCRLMERVLAGRV